MFIVISCANVSGSQSSRTNRRITSTNRFVGIASYSCSKSIKASLYERFFKLFFLTIMSLMIIIFYHANKFLNEKTYSQNLYTLVNRTAIMKNTESWNIVLHKIDILLTDHLLEGQTLLLVFLGVYTSLQKKWAKSRKKKNLIILILLKNYYLCKKYTWNDIYNLPFSNYTYCFASVIGVPVHSVIPNKHDA